MSTTVADPDAIDLRPPLLSRALRFCRRQPLGTFGLALVLLGLKLTEQILYRG